MKTDALFYRLFQALPGLVFELAGIKGLSGQSYQFRSEEVKQTAFRLDDERRYGSAVEQLEVYRVYLEDWADVPASTLGLRLVQLMVGKAADAPVKAIS